eukprot:GILI01004165.1.p1 GENE.GILI01004165.1~~GILI01004165.1.p1  ORF type:complete len:206 (-),score=35.92 GILI01004165.1:114-731(-)
MLLLFLFFFSSPSSSSFSSSTSSSSSSSSASLSSSFPSSSCVTIDSSSSSSLPSKCLCSLLPSSHPQTLSPPSPSAALPSQDLLNAPHCSRFPPFAHSSSLPPHECPPHYCPSHPQDQPTTPSEPVIYTRKFDWSVPSTQCFFASTQLQSSPDNSPFSWSSQDLSRWSQGKSNLILAADVIYDDRITDLLFSKLRYEVSLVFVSL